MAQFHWLRLVIYAYFTVCQSFEFDFLHHLVNALGPQV